MGAKFKNLPPPGPEPMIFNCPPPLKHPDVIRIEVTVKTEKKDVKKV